MLVRMVRSRLVLLEALLGRPWASRSTKKALDRSPRSMLTLLEAWNDLVVASSSPSSKPGQTEKAEDSLNAAAGAIVGLPFLELDGWIELLRTRSAELRGGLVNARRFAHRSLQCLPGVP